MSETASRSGRDSRGARRWPSLTTLIFVSVGLGISCGVFLGEIAAPLKFVGDAYVGLLQMTVLPYIVVSLIASIGRLSVSEGRLLARYGLIVLLALWGLSAATVFVMALALPPLEVGAFFSTSLIEAPAPVNHLDIYIPSNPFNSLSSNYVPAVVLFFGLFGIAIMKVRGKEALISQLEIAALALRRINGFVINLTPVGVFAISASAFGTLSLEELGRLQGYLLTFTAAVLFLTFLVMPLLVAAVTPFRYRDILAASRDALITAFVTGSVFVVIPLMIEGISQLYEAANADRDHADAHPEFIIPLGYAFPSSGKIVSLIFVPFAAWFYGESFGLADFSVLLSAGLFLSFGKLTVAIPYLLEAERLPADIFQLFLVSGVFAGRVAELANVMHIMAFTIVTSSAVAGLAKLRGGRLARLAVTSGAVALVAVLGIRGFLAYSFEDAFQKDQVLAEMQLMRGLADQTVLSEASPNPVALEPGESRLGRIRRRGVIRIGYLMDRLPFSYFNAAGDLVGYDVELAHHLAQDLGASIEFVPYQRDTLLDQLDADHFDFAVSGIAGVPSLAERALLSDPYLVVHLGVIVPDHRAVDFATANRIRALGPIRMGILEKTYFGDRIRAEGFDNVELVELETERDFFAGKVAGLDGLVTSAEGGAAWTLIYPKFKFVHAAEDGSFGVPLVFVIGGREDSHFREYLGNWIGLNRLDGTSERLFNYWILGRHEKTSKRRWSVLRNVLGWVE